MVTSRSVLISGGRVEVQRLNMVEPMRHLLKLNFTKWSRKINIQSTRCLDKRQLKYRNQSIFDCHESGASSPTGALCRLFSTFGPSLIVVTNTVVVVADVSLQRAERRGEKRKEKIPNTNHVSSLVCDPIQNGKSMDRLFIMMMMMMIIIQVSAQIERKRRVGFNLFTCRCKSSRCLLLEFR